MYRLHPSWVAVRDLVASGRIGALQAVDAWFSYFNDDPDDIRNILDAGGGALWDIGCYAVNVARVLFGAEPVAVEATVVRDPGTRCDVLTAGLLTFEQGTTTFGCATRAEPDQRVHVYGSHGRITVPIPFNVPPDRPAEVHVTHGGAPPVSPHTEVLTFGPADQYRLQAEAFAAAVLDSAPVPIPPTDSVANVAVIERAFAAGARP
jgi:predicted dehydrogenase